LRCPHTVATCITPVRRGTDTARMRQDRRPIMKEQRTDRLAPHAAARTAVVFRAVPPRPCTVVQAMWLSAPGLTTGTLSDASAAGRALDPMAMLVIPMGTDRGYLAPTSDTEA